MPRWLPVLLIVLAPAASAHAASCPGADTTVSSASLASAKAAVLCIANAERTARGLPALAENDKLALAAQRHTDDMVARDFFSHFAPLPALLGVDPGARITAAGYVWQSYGENIAVGQTTPREVMTDWLKSPGHCRNLLDPGVTQLGVGVADVPATLGDQPGGTWTQDFANPQGTVAPAASRTPQAGCDPSGYPALTGLDAARQPDASGSPSNAGGAASGTTSGGQNSQQNVDVPTTPRDPASNGETLSISLRHVADLLTVGGSVRPWDRRRHLVTVVVRRGRHTLRRRHARLSATGRFRIRLSRIPGSGSLTVRVAVGRLRVTRTVGR